MNDIDKIEAFLTIAFVDDEPKVTYINRKYNGSIIKYIEFNLNIFRVKDQQSKTPDLSVLPNTERLQKTKALVGNMLSYDNGHFVCIVFEEPKNMLIHIKFHDEKYTLQICDVISITEVNPIYSMESTSLEILFLEDQMLYKHLIECYNANIKIDIIEMSLE